jgi:hypothetical protein
MKQSAKIILDRLRQDEGEWVSGNALAAVGSWRFGGRIYELRHQYGFVIERKSDPRSPVDLYRLVPQDEQLTLEDAVA